MIRSTRGKTLASALPKDIPKVKEEIKASLPLLRAADIRRLAIPYNEVLVAELHEEGFHEAAEYFKFLFELDEETRKTAGPDTLIWYKPRLADNEQYVDRLRSVLLIFCQRTIPAADRTLAMIDTALFFQNLTWEWWWIAETLYRSAFYIAKEIENDDKQIINILRFIYARFLFFQMKNAQTALEYIREAYQESRHKSWNASDIVGFEQESLFNESCALLHQVLLQIARQTRDCDVQTSIDSCRVALNASNESGHDELVAEVEYEFGKSEFTAGNIEEAITHFINSLNAYEQIHDAQGTCTVHAELVNAYKQIGNKDIILRHLEEMTNIASKFQLQQKLAEAYYLTAEYYLSRANLKEAIPSAEYAFSLYNRLGLRIQANSARCLVGVTKGKDITDAYKVLIKRSVEGDADAILKICQWRDRGELF
ncbi:uncharacterized protein LOC131668466 [Phymastichus coffea]|uniref:uncharacterized protein LOC131668466 n=1 Tax=Phymastichus coffea TaxID=108790 RepID=UPI00273CF490|nr:uncharacterized protein LOC131668466 [Phymastichus coffea]